jgi:hypothetical protein
MCAGQHLQKTESSASPVNIPNKPYCKMMSEKGQFLVLSDMDTQIKI